MVRGTVPRRGDVYWIDPNPTSGREMKDRHRFVVITPREINALGVCMTVPVTTGGAIVRQAGLAVPITGHATAGVAVCNQVRSSISRHGQKRARHVSSRPLTARPSTRSSRVLSAPSTPENA